MKITLNVFQFLVVTTTAAMNSICLIVSLTFIGLCTAGELASLHRYYHSGIQDHFYTTNFNELKSGGKGWAYEGVQCMILQHQYPESVPLYRYWNGKDHFYTTNINEIGTSKAGVRGRHGYVSEGITGYCYPKQDANTVPLYRYYKHHRNDHFYTTSKSEIGTIVAGQVGKHGYVSEGIACFVYPKM